MSAGGSFGGKKRKFKFEVDADDLMLPYTFDLQSSALLYVDNVATLSRLDKALKGCSILGIDTEAKPSYAPRRYVPPNATSLIQIAIRREKGEEEVHIIDMLALDAAGSDTLARLDSILLVHMRSSRCIKIGQGLEGDFKELVQAYPEMNSFRHVESVLETFALVKQLQPETKNMVSLKNLVRQYLNYNLVKTQQMSNWGARPLSKSQLMYAACDALVLLRLFDAMSCEVKDRIDQELQHQRKGKGIAHSGGKAQKNTFCPYSLCKSVNLEDVTTPAHGFKRATCVINRTCTGSNSNRDSTSSSSMNMSSLGDKSSRSSKGNDVKAVGEATIGGVAVLPIGATVPSRGQAETKLVDSQANILQAALQKQQMQQMQQPAKRRRLDEAGTSANCDPYTTASFASSPLAVAAARGVAGDLSTTAQKRRLKRNQLRTSVEKPKGSPEYGQGQPEVRNEGGEKYLTSKKQKSKSWWKKQKAHHRSSKSNSL